MLATSRSRLSFYFLGSLEEITEFIPCDPRESPRFGSHWLVLGSLDPGDGVSPTQSVWPKSGSYRNGGGYKTGQSIRGSSLLWSWKCFLSHAFGIKFPCLGIPQSFMPCDHFAGQ